MKKVVAIMKDGRQLEVTNTDTLWNLVFNGDVIGITLDDVITFDLRKAEKALTENVEEKLLSAYRENFENSVRRLEQNYTVTCGYSIGDDPYNVSVSIFIYQTWHFQTTISLTDTKGFCYELLVKKLQSFWLSKIEKGARK